MGLLAPIPPELLHVDKVIKSARKRIKLLFRIRPFISPHVALTIYQSMIKPILLYCSPVLTTLSHTANNKIESLQRRCGKYIGHNLNLSSILCERKRSVAVKVFKAINSIGPDSLFASDFEFIDHNHGTRSNKSLLRLPRVKTEHGRKRFSFQGSIIFNQLDTASRTERSLIRFRRMVKSFEFDTSPQLN